MAILSPSSDPVGSENLLKMVPDRLTVTQWNIGQWMVNWQLNYWPTEEILEICSSAAFGTTQKFKCGGQQTYEILFLFRSTDVVYSLRIVQPGTNEERPKNVFTVIQGKVKKLIQSSQNSWIIKWKNSVVHELEPLKELYLHNFPSHNFPNIQLLIDFQKPSSTSFDKITGEKRVLKHLSDMLESGLMADIAFIVKGRKIDAHSNIVASGSPVFTAMFQEDTFKEAQTKVVTIDDMDPEVFQEILRYIYTGVAKTKEMAEPLFLAADKYQIDSLKVECEAQLKKSLSVDNVVRRLVLAHLYSAADLLERAIQFIIAHKHAIWFRPEWKELSKNYLDLFFVVMQKMVIV